MSSAGYSELGSAHICGYNKLGLCLYPVGFNLTFDLSQHNP